MRRRITTFVILCFSALCIPTTESFGQLSGDPVTEIRRGLSSSDAETQIKSARRAGELGPDGAELANDLARVAINGDNDVAPRQEAISALGQIGQGADSATETLAGIIASDKAEELLRLSAIDAVRKINPKPQQVRDALASARVNENLYLASALAELSIDPETPSKGDFAEALKSQLVDPSATEVERQQVGLALSLCGDHGRSVLIKLLSNENADVRASACEAIGAMGEEASAAVPALVKLLDDNAAVSRQAALALGEIGTGSQSALPALEKKLSDSDSGVRAASASAISRYAETNTLSKELIAKLSEALDDESSGVAVQAAGALENVGLPAISALSDKLGSEESRALAAAVIGQIAEKAEGKRQELVEVAPKLVDLITAKIASGDGLSLPDQTTRDEVIRALASLGPSLDKAEIVPKLRAAVEDKNYSGRAAAALALAQIAGKEAIPTLKAASLDPTDKWLQAASSIALVRLQADDPAAAATVIPQLLKLLQEKDGLAGIRENILATIASANGKTPLPINDGEVRQIADMLRDDDPKVRLAAIDLLENLGKKATFLRKQLILTSLRLGRFDSDANVRAAAKNALAEVE